MDSKVEASDDSNLLKLKVNKLREERNARQAARLQLLKNLHLQKVPRESLYLSGSQSSAKAPSLLHKKDESKIIPISNFKKENDQSHRNATAEFNLILSKSKKIEGKHRQNLKTVFPPPSAKPDPEKKLLSNDIHLLKKNEKPLQQVKASQGLDIPKQVQKVERKQVKFTVDLKHTDSSWKNEFVKPNQVNLKRQTLHNQFATSSTISKESVQKPLLSTKRLTLHTTKPVTMNIKDLPIKKFDKRQTLHNPSVLENNEIPVKKPIVNKRQTIHASQVSTSVNKDVIPKNPVANKRQTLHNSQTSAVTENRNLLKKPTVNKRQILHASQMSATSLNKETTVKKPILNKRQTLNTSKVSTILKNGDNNSQQNGIKRKTIHTSEKPISLGQVNENRPKANDPNLRRSLSTVHFKRLGEKAAKDCFKRTFSSGAIKYKEIEEELPREFPPKEYIMPVESEKKKSVSFFTPLSKNSTYRMVSNTPNPNELRKRLNDWLQKRGKSLSTYHHLKCFGLHLNHSLVKSPIHDQLDDEDKENVEVIDDGSFNENITGKTVDIAADCRSKINSTNNTSIDNIPIKQNDVLTPNGRQNKSLDPIVSEALYDLSNLILEDYSWVQCAEWLRAITRECGENIKNIPAYWECRAALEEKRGDFVRTFDCFQNALRQGAQPSNIDESLDNLLQKFMKLNLDPNLQCGQADVSSQKLVDVKNVFKSSLIRFAIKQMNTDDDGTFHKQFTATPVRRSSRISTVNDKNNARRVTPAIAESTTMNPLNKKSSSAKEMNPTNRSTQKERKHLVQLCESLRNVDDDIKQTLIFVPNKALNFNDCL